jgi:hypothetical protein
MYEMDFCVTLLIAAKKLFKTSDIFVFPQFVAKGKRKKYHIFK